MTTPQVAPVRMALYLSIDTDPHGPLLTTAVLVVTPRVDPQGSPWLGRPAGPLAEWIRLGRLTSAVEGWALRGPCPAVCEEYLLIGLVDADLALGVDGTLVAQDVRQAMVEHGGAVRPVVVDLVMQAEVVIYPGLRELLADELPARLPGEVVP